MAAGSKGGAAGAELAWFYRPAASYALVGAIAALIVFLRLGLTTLEEHEAKAALAARGMIRSDAWLVQGETQEDLPADTPRNRLLIPIFNGRPRLKKTPLGYWCIAAAAALGRTGDVNELAARLPSAIAAVLCAWVTLALGRRCFSPRAALWGAVMLATSVGLQKWGRNGRPEMVLCLLTTAAMASFHTGLTAKTRARRAVWMLVFWLLMGLANLTKQFFPLLLGLPLIAFVFWHEQRQRQGETPLADGSSRRLLAWYCLATAAAIAMGILATVVLGAVPWPFAAAGKTTVNIAVMAALICGPLIWYGLKTRGWRRVLGLLPTAVPGIVIMCAAFLPWILHMQGLFGQGSELLGEQVAERAAGTGKWTTASPHYYLVPLVTLTLPWVGFLPGAFASPWLKRFAQHRRGLVYLFLWAAGLIALATLSAVKRDHYLLPAVPAVCLLMGFVAEDVFFEHRWISARLGRALGIAYGAAFVLTPLAVAVAWLASVHGIGRLRLLADEPARWVHMLIVGGIVAVPAGAALSFSLRRRLRPVLALLVASVAAIYVGYHLRGDLWDDREPVARFATAASQMAGSDAVVAWGDPQAKTVFYFGRYIPNALWTRDRLIAQHGQTEGTVRWKAWIGDRRNAAWLFTYQPEVDRLASFGFRPAMQVQGMQRKQLLFTLMKQTGERKSAT